MKIVVMYEDPSEEAAAENLARVLPRLGPSLANAAIDAGGSVSIRSGASTVPVRIRTRVCSAAEESGFVSLAQEQEWDAAQWRAAFQAAPGAIWATPNDMPPNVTVKRAFGGRIVSAIPSSERSDYSPCPRCGRMKYDGAYCVCDPGTAIPTPPPKPPRETRDLIFPDEDV